MALPYFHSCSLLIRSYSLAFILRAPGFSLLRSLFGRRTVIIALHRIQHKRVSLFWEPAKLVDNSFHRIFSQQSPPSDGFNGEWFCECNANIHFILFVRIDHFFFCRWKHRSCTFRCLFVVLRDWFYKQFCLTTLNMQLVKNKMHLKSKPFQWTDSFETFLTLDNFCNCK